MTGCLPSICKALVVQSAVLEKKKKKELEMSQKSNFKLENQDKESIKRQVSGRYTNGKRGKSSLKLSIATNFL